MCNGKKHNYCRDNPFPVICALFPCVFVDIPSSVGCATVHTLDAQYYVLLTYNCMQVDMAFSQTTASLSNDILCYRVCNYQHDISVTYIKPCICKCLVFQVSTTCSSSMLSHYFW